MRVCQSPGQVKPAARWAAETMDHRPAFGDAGDRAGGRVRL